MSFLWFHSRAAATEHRYLSLSTHSRLCLPPDFTVPALAGRTFNSVLDAYTAAVEAVSSEERLPQETLMELLLECRYTQDMYYRQLIDEYVSQGWTLAYDSDHPFWGAQKQGKNMIGKLMMKIYFSFI
jgi:hypothetical protein